MNSSDKNIQKKSMNYGAIDRNVETTRLLEDTLSIALSTEEIGNYYFYYIYIYFLILI